ncbi:class I SAM-dependent methyltransferase [Virgibacillus oceani]|uniref:class I SAM-dependent methyltransferase n=1 Tax=Virgibacillus oceani TaxID=1479511 RepID=UPI001E3CD353|nr:class I SAM-dependent methyltransferase [Virgibacillus oceani]
MEGLNFKGNPFDTIVSSGTLCAYNDPVYVLNEMNKWCKWYGQILLMEHGLYSSAPLAWLQKKVDSLNVKMIGCHLDRDIFDIIRSSKIEIDKCERVLGGYLYLIWAKPNKYV